MRCGIQVRIGWSRYINYQKEVEVAKSLRLNKGCTSYDVRVSSSKSSNTECTKGRHCGPGEVTQE